MGETPFSRRNLKLLKVTGLLFLLGSMWANKFFAWTIIVKIISWAAYIYKKEVGASQTELKSWSKTASIHRQIKTHGDSSVAKRTCSYSRVLCSGSSTTTCNSSFKESYSFFWPRQAPGTGTHMMHIHTHKQDLIHFILEIHFHIRKIFYSGKEKKIDFLAIHNKL